MEIPSDLNLGADPLDSVAAALQEAGSALVGTPPPLRTWLEIAKGMRVSDALRGTIVGRLRRLATAEDVQRLRRDVRRWRLEATRRHSARRGGPSRVARLRETDLDEHTLGQATELLRPPPGGTQTPDTTIALPPDALIEAVLRRLEPPIAPSSIPSPGTLGHALAPGALLALHLASGSRPEAVGITWALDRLGAPDSWVESSTSPLHAGDALDWGARRALHRAGLSPQPRDDWEWLRAAIAAEFTGPAEAVPHGTFEALAEACEGLATDAPPETLEAHLSDLQSAHVSWAPLGLFAALRNTGRRPRGGGLDSSGQPLRPLHAKEWLGLLPTAGRSILFWCALHQAGDRSLLSSAARKRRPDPEDRVDIAPHGQDAAAEDLADTAEVRPLPTHLAQGASQCLGLAAGTLRRSDYPAFTIVSKLGYLGALSAREHQLLDRHFEHTLEWRTQTLVRRRYGGEDAPLDFLLPLDLATHSLGRGRPPVTEVGMITLHDRLRRHIIAYVFLKGVVFRDRPDIAPQRLSAKHIRRFWSDPSSAALAEQVREISLAHLADRWPGGYLEAVAHALLCLMHEVWPTTSGEGISLKEEMITAIRQVAHARAAVGENELGLSYSGDAQERSVRKLARIYIEGPLAMRDALGLPGDQSLPMLAGGQFPAEERAIRRVLRSRGVAIAGEAPARDSPIRRYECRPMSKVAALLRGDLGGDCSSSHIPYRALSPHHIFYGFFEGDRQLRGYMTLVEAWARDTRGRRRPVLCIETINAPSLGLDSILPDVIALVEAIARSRGLSPQVALSLNLNTWNYGTLDVLRELPRVRAGTAVILEPADPDFWHYHGSVTGEAGKYTPLNDPLRFGRDERAHVIVAPSTAESLATDILPENMHEVLRLERLPKHRIVTTATDDAGRVTGFISSLPNVVE